MVKPGCGPGASDSQPICLQLSGTAFISLVQFGDPGPGQSWKSQLGLMVHVILPLEWESDRPGFKCPPGSQRLSDFSCQKEDKRVNQCMHQQGHGRQQRMLQRHFIPSNPSDDLMSSRCHHRACQGSPVCLSARLAHRQADSKTRLCGLLFQGFSWQVLYQWCASRRMSHTKHCREGTDVQSDSPGDERPNNAELTQRPTQEGVATEREEDTRGLSTGVSEARNLEEGLVELGSPKMGWGYVAAGTSEG